MNKLLIATNNPHKLEEFQEIFADLPITLTSLAAEGISLDPEETGTTFEANALLKAQAFTQLTELPVLADDSGLEIDALGGEPGVYSARYANTAKNDHKGRCQVVLAKLADTTPWTERTARFRCVITIVQQGRLIGTAQGSVEGFIDHEMKGQNGFGYDPIFFYPEFNQTLSQLSPDQKHAISHRGRAARAAVPLIKECFELS